MNWLLSAKHDQQQSLAVTISITNKFNIACLNILTFFECDIVKVHASKKIMNMERIGEDNVIVYAYVGNLKINGSHFSTMLTDGML